MRADPSPSTNSSTAPKVSLPEIISPNRLLTSPADALRSLLIIPCDPYDRPSAPTPNSASRRYATMASTRTTPDPDENISTTTPEDKALMAAYLDGLRVCTSPIIHNYLFSQHVSLNRIKDRLWLGGNMVLVLQRVFARPSRPRPRLLTSPRIKLPHEPIMVFVHRGLSWCEMFI